MKPFDKVPSESHSNSREMDLLSIIDRPYEIINEYTKKQSDKSHAIAFNKEQTIMVAGCGNNKISVFEFKQGQLNQKQILSDHSCNRNIVTLYFMSKQNQFISGTHKEIGIWGYNNTTQLWYCLQMLKYAHSNWVNRVIMNKNEDLIISCSDDFTIKFWTMKKWWECSQTLTNHKDWVHCISLNESCTQLASSGYDQYILISEKGGDQKWRKIQRIILQQYGLRLCFVSDNLILFQPYNGNNMQTYKLNQQNKQFMKSKDITVLSDDMYCNYWFPMQFNKNKQILLNKNGNRINLIRKYNNEFIVEQSINFDRSNFWGAMTDDFAYLVTWNFQNLEFQVRRQKKI